MIMMRISLLVFFLFGDLLRLSPGKVLRTLLLIQGIAALRRSIAGVLKSFSNKASQFVISIVYLTMIVLAKERTWQGSIYTSLATAVLCHFLYDLARAIWRDLSNACLVSLLGCLTYLYILTIDDDLMKTEKCYLAGKEKYLRIWLGMPPPIPWSYYLWAPVEGLYHCLQEEQQRHAKVAEQPSSSTSSSPIYLFLQVPSLLSTIDTLLHICILSVALVVVVIIAKGMLYLYHQCLFSFIKRRKGERRSSTTRGNSSTSSNTSPLSSFHWGSYRGSIDPSRKII